MECVCKSTFGLSFVGRFVLFWSVLYRRYHCITNFQSLTESVNFYVDRPYFLQPSNRLWPLWWVQCWRLGNEKLKPFQEPENGLLIAMCLIVWSVWESKKVCTMLAKKKEFHADTNSD